MIGNWVKGELSRFCSGFCQLSVGLCLRGNCHMYKASLGLHAGESGRQFRPSTARCMDNVV
jgi:hypothetical protein